jgi:hypothetical protein
MLHPTTAQRRIVMARPLSTYRGARAQLALAGAAAMLALTTTPKHSPIRKQKALQVMPEPKYCPVQPKGWDWRKGGRRERDIARELTMKLAEAGVTLDDPGRIA